MVPVARAGLARLAVLALLALPSAALCGDKVQLGQHKDWNDIDSVDIKALFKLADYSLVAVAPFETKDVELPAKDDNTHKPVVDALERFNDRLLAEMQERLKVKVQRAESDSAPGTSKGLLIRGKVTKMWPGSAAARFFGGFGAGRALVEIDSEVVDAQTGNVLVALNHARTSGGSGSLGYDDVLKKITQRLGKDMVELLERFE